MIDYKNRQIELLSPAANLEVGKAAISCGADAIYIGGPKFGARYRALNSLEDIDVLVNYAHIYGAKVYTTLNTLLEDSELDEAVDLINSYYNMGVDAVIIQDMGLLECDLPPIALHASTQCHISTREKAEFLKSVGFNRVVVARELSLLELSDISSIPDLEVEAFVHGALCVSYSGQCYMSCAISRRSGNRGDCIQACRLPYSLENASDKLLCVDKHLLSIKDYNASERIEEMLKAGVKSFKIEGRLKDKAYVKNVTAAYRQILDRVQHKESNIELNFTPDLNRTFNRFYTDYFLDGERKKVGSIDSPKAFGERVGEVKAVFNKIGACQLQVSTNVVLNAGDGLCYLDERDDLQGFRINRAEGENVFLHKDVDIHKGDILYRNQDVEFDKLLSVDECYRRIDIFARFYELDNAYILELKDKDNLLVSYRFEGLEIAKDAEKAVDNIRKQVSKLKDTPYLLKEIDIDCKKLPFIPISVLNNVRRELIESLNKKREEKNIPEEVYREDALKIYTEDSKPKTEATYKENILNKKAEEFYKKHGVIQTEEAIEALVFDGQHIKPDTELMVCKHCIRFELNQCFKYDTLDEDFKQDLYLVNRDKRFLLKFDCENCRMHILTTNY